MSEHPRWKLIPTIDVVTILDLDKMIKIIQDKFYPELLECAPEDKEEKLKEIFRVREEMNTLSVP